MELVVGKVGHPQVCTAGNTVMQWLKHQNPGSHLRSQVHHLSCVTLGKFLKLSVPHFLHV